MLCYASYMLCYALLCSVRLLIVAAVARKHGGDAPGARALMRAASWTLGVAGTVDAEAAIIASHSIASHSIA
jgi:hypothetical protein